MNHIDPLDFLGLLVPPPPGFTRFCGSCGAVWGGCGCERKRVVAETQPAPVAEPPAKEETWRDRPALL